jgi:hypothetical protein
VRSCWSSRGSTCGGSIARYFLLHDSISRFDVCVGVALYECRDCLCCCCCSSEIDNAICSDMLRL